MFRKVAEKVYLIAPILGVLAIVFGHAYYDSLHPLESTRVAYTPPSEHHEKQKRGDLLLAEGDDRLAQLTEQAKRGLAENLTDEEQAHFPTPDEVTADVRRLYGQERPEARAAFIVGINFLAEGELTHAARMFRKSLAVADTPSAHMALGYTLKTLGEDLSSADEYAAVRDYADRLGEPDLVNRAYHLADASAEHHSVMLGVGILVGALISLFMLSVMLIIWLRARRRTLLGIAPNEWPHIRQVLYLRRIRAADEEGLDIIEREIGGLIDRRNDGFADRNRPLPLADVRAEVGKALADDDGEAARLRRLDTQRDYLSALLMEAIGYPLRAQKYFESALKRIDVSAIHYALAVSLFFDRKIGLARAAALCGVERGEALGEPSVVERAHRLLSLM